MNTRNRIYLIFFLALGIIFLIIAIVQQQINHYELASLTETQVQNFIETYTTGFPTPWNP